MGWCGRELLLLGLRALHILLFVVFVVVWVVLWVCVSRGCCVYAWIFGLVFCVVVLLGLEVVWVGCGLRLTVVGIGI